MCRQTRFLVVLVLFLGIALTTGPARAAGGEWRTLPIWGADVRSLAVHPDDPDRVFAGTSAGQLYVSRDAGRTWANAGAPLPFPGWVVSALRFDPNHPGRLWVSLQGIWGGGHVGFSDDLGASWVSRAAGLPEEPVYTIALVPGQEGRLYAGTLSGVWGTEDGGGSWRRLTAALPEAQKVTSLLVDSNRPETVIAGTWRRAYRTEDGGRTWAGVFDGMVLDSEVFSLTPAAGRPGEIWATTCGWVYRTLDGGNKWERFKEGFEERRTPSFSILADGKLLAGTVAGLHVSTDGGRTWKRVGDPALAIHAIAWHPKRPGRVYLGTEGSGIWVSGDDAASFHPSSSGMTNTRISSLSAVGNDLLVALSHAGPSSGLHVSRDRGRTFGASGEDFAPLPTVLDLGWHEGRVYAATERGLYERRGKAWFRLKELGDSRVEQILSDGPELLARTSAGLWELRKGVFVAKPSAAGAPRSAAFFDGALWVSGGEGLYRLAAAPAGSPGGTAGKPGGAALVETPFPGGRLHRLPDQLLLWGSGGAWTRSEPGWLELTGKASRLLSTGDARWPSLLVSGETVRLYDREARRFRMISVPVPARDLSVAQIVDGNLMIGTSGYGVLVREVAHDLFPDPAPAAQPEAPVAGAGAGSG